MERKFFGRGRETEDSIKWAATLLPLNKKREEKKSKKTVKTE